MLIEQLESNTNAYVRTHVNLVWRLITYFICQSKLILFNMNHAAPRIYLCGDEDRHHVL